jgi:heme-degrading monooxygenase HmoA
MNHDGGGKAVTLINVFRVAAGRQDELIELLETAADAVMAKQPGYISATFHRSLDGTKVANYARWRSREDFEAVMRDPDVAAHMGRVSAIADVDPVLYQVVSTHRADEVEA